MECKRRVELSKSITHGLAVLEHLATQKEKKGTDEELDVSQKDRS